MTQSKHKQITFEKIATNAHFPVVLHVDFGKHILTPKVSSQENYFTSKLKSRQFGLYNAGEHKYYVFVWPEHVAGKGADEVCSCLYVLFTDIINISSRFLIIWSDNCPSEFKSNKVMHFLDWLTRTDFLSRIDMKFLVAGHTYCIVDRKNGNLENVLKKYEKIGTLADWIRIVSSNFREDRVHVINMEKENFRDWTNFFKGFYTARNEGILEGDLVHYVYRDIRHINFGFGERLSTEGILCTWKHKPYAWLRKSFDSNEPPIEVDFGKKKQRRPLGLEPPRVISQCLVQESIKSSALDMARKYFDQETVMYYASLPSTSQ